MKIMRTTIVAAILTAFIALPSIGHINTPAAAQDEVKAGKFTSALPGGTYDLDPAHCVIGFAVRHLEINWVEGRFKDLTGTINYNGQDVTKSTVQFAAKTESIDTGVAPRDQHLRSPDFFEVAKYPEMTFVSTKIEKKGKDKYTLHGHLTIKGVTKQIEFPFTFTGAIKDPWGNTRFGIEAHTKINRRDYGINYVNALAGGGFDIGDEITINLQLEAFKPDPKTIRQ